MPDFVYLLENRLSNHQQSALRAVREAARQAQMPVFLVGDAVRDLVSGNSVRELEVVVHGNTADLRKTLVAQGATAWWENASARRLSLRFPGSVLLEIASARHADYPKCGKPVYTWASIHEDLRSRDFTVNAMAISLNDGSYGLLMDPLNGIADLELRQLRLVSNYGFLEEPARLVRASRLRVRLGFQFEERTQRRYDNAREESMIQYLSEEERRRELEQILHEEEALKVIAAHEADGWMKALFPAWTAAKVDVEKLQALHDFSIQLAVQGVHADLSTAQAHFLTAKLSAKDQAALKDKLLRPGFVKAWEGLEASAAQLAKAMTAKDNARPSACYNLLTSFAPEAVVWLGFTAKQAAIREKFDAFLKTWPEHRQKLPVAMMAEMRITPELPEYGDLVRRIFLRLIDGELQADEEMRAFLEPHSPPAPAPPPSYKRSRARRGAEPRVKARVVEEDEDDSEENVGDLDEDGVELDFRIGDSDEGRILGDEDDAEDDDVFARDSVSADETEDMDDDEEDEPKAVVGRGNKAAKGKVGSKPVPAVAARAEKPGTKSKKATKVAAPAAKPAPRTPTTTAAKPASKVEAKAEKAKPTKTATAKPAVMAKPAKVKVSVAKSVASKSGKPKTSPTKSAKNAPKTAPKAAAKPSAKKSAAKPAAKRPAAKAKPARSAKTAKPAARSAPVKKAVKAGKPVRSATKPVTRKKKR